MNWKDVPKDKVGQKWTWEEHKKCSRCKRYRTREHFPWQLSGDLWYPWSRCWKCQREYMREYRLIRKAEGRPLK